MSGTVPKTDHRLSAVHWTTPISGKPSRLTCACSWEYEAMPDRGLPDPHEPFVREWLAHRKAVGAPLAAKGAGPGWGRMSLKPDTEYVTALGTSKLSARERGLMGAASKRKKRAAA